MESKNLIYELTKSEWEMCVDFALFAPNNHSLRAHRGDEIRDKRTLQIRVLTGKTGEVALQHFLKSYFPTVQVDMEKDKITDFADFLINDKAIEVKTIKNYAKYLLIEPKNIYHKLKLAQPLPFLNVLMSNHWNREKDQPSRIVSFEGFVYNYDLFDDKRTSIFKKGEKLPNANQILKQTNFVVSRKDLRKNFYDLIQALTV